MNRRRQILDNGIKQIFDERLVLLDILAWLNNPDRPAIRSVFAGGRRTWHIDGDERTFSSVQELVAAMEDA